MQEPWVQSLGREDSPGEGNGNPLQYSFLGTPIDKEACWATVHGSQRRDMAEYSYIQSFFPVFSVWKTGPVELIL